MRYTASRTSALISVKLVLQPDTSQHCKTMDSGHGLMHHTVCLFNSPSLCWILTMPTYRGVAQAGLTWWLVLSQGGLPAFGRPSCLRVGNSRVLTILLSDVSRQFLSSAIFFHITYSTTPLPSTVWYHTSTIF